MPPSSADDEGPVGRANVRGRTMSERMSGEVNILMIVWGLCGRVRDAILSIDLDVRTTSMRRWWLGLMSKTEAERLIVPSTYNTRGIQTQTQSDSQVRYQQYRKLTSSSPGSNKSYISPRLPLLSIT